MLRGVSHGTTSPPVELLELANALGVRIGRLVRILVRDVEGPSRTQQAVLATLEDAGPRRITELAAAERVAQPSMTVLVSRLERRGWVERRPDPEDGRVVMAAITDDGARALARVRAARAEALAARLDVLTPDERRTLAAAIPLLDRVIDA
jgi:DNA-binding MarR family transcriptional regulator